MNRHERRKEMRMQKKAERKKAQFDRAQQMAAEKPKPEEEIQMMTDRTEEVLVKEETVLSPTIAIPAEDHPTLEEGKPSLTVELATFYHHRLTAIEADLEKLRCAKQEELDAKRQKVAADPDNPPLQKEAEKCERVYLQVTRLQINIMKHHMKLSTLIEKDQLKKGDLAQVQKVIEKGKQMLNK